MNHAGRHAAVMAAAFAWMSIAGCDRLMSAESRLERAQSALDEGKLNAAVADAKAVAEKGGTPAVHLLFARINLKQGNSQGALEDLEHAKAAGVPEAEIRPLKLQALAAARRHEDVLTEVRGDESAEGRTQAATALLTLGRRDEAVAALAPLLAGKSPPPEAELVQARAEAEAGNREAARTRLDRVVAAHPELARAWMLRSRVLASLGDTKQAIASLEEARKTSVAQLSMPEQWSLLVEMAELKLAVNDIAGAASDVEALKRQIPNALPTQVLTARVLMSQKSVDAAVRVLQAAHLAWPEDTQVNLLLASALIEHGSREQARTQLGALLAEHPEETAGRRLLAQLLISEGELVEAGRVLDAQPEDAAPDAGIEWLRGVVFAARGRTADALKALERAAAANRDSVRLQLELASAYLSANRASDARAVLQQVPPEKLGLPGRSLQVLALAVGLPPAEARTAVLEMAGQNPKDASAQVAVGQYLLQVGDTTAAALRFRQALTLDPGVADAYLGLASEAFRRSDFAAAEVELQRLVRQLPADERGYLSLAVLAVRQGKPEQAEQHLRQAISAAPQAVNSRMVLAQIAAGRKDKALVKSLLTQAASLAPDKLPIYMRAAMIEAAVQDYDAALANVEAYRKAGGSQARAEEMRGTVLLAQKQVSQALGALENSFRLQPTGLLALKVFAARRDSGVADADRVLLDWIRTHPDDLAVRLGLANHLLAQKAYPAAIQQFEVVARGAANPAVLNNLAWAYQQVGDRRALQTAEQAYKNSGQNPEIADTYGWILLSDDKAAEALPLLKLAAEARPDDSTIQSHYADALQATGAADQAAAVRARARK